VELIHFIELVIFFLPFFGPYVLCMRICEQNDTEDEDEFRSKQIHLL